MDFCCHGGQTLAAACKARGVAVAQIEAELAALDPTPASACPNVNPMAVDELARHIVATHHNFTKKALPTLSARLETVVCVHGGRHPELSALLAAFVPLREELEQHLAKEERVLFPYLEAMSRARRDGAPLPQACFAEVSQPIAALEREHEAAGATLDRMHDSTGGFLPPEDACNTYRLLFMELTELEQDLHRHIALENYLLFPQAVELENTLKGGR